VITESLATTGARWRLQRQPGVSLWAGIVFRVVAVLLALFISGVIIELSGLSALSLARRALESTLGSAYGLEQAGVLATSLILTGLAVAVGMRMRLWNIGAEGQFYMGAWAATAIGIHITDGPVFPMFVAMFLAAALAGALWILIPALARAYWNVNEIITTLLLNFVAVLFVNHFAIGPWRDRGAAVLVATYRIPYELPTLTGSLHVGILIAIVIAIVLALTMQNTRWGYEVATIGGNRRAAEFTGIPVTRNILTVMLLSGAIAGVAGMIVVTGTAHRLSGFISNDYGYTGIIVAAMANGSPLVTILVGYLLAVLLNAGIVLQTQGLSVNTVIAINGLILIFAAVGEVAAQYRLVRTGAVADVETAAPAQVEKTKQGIGGE
jgi:simple sugar transport system permease protein